LWDIYTQDEDKNKCLWIITGLHADIETLAVLHECGMQFSDTVVRAAALSGRLDVLQHLLIERQCPTPYRLSDYAARSGSISMLKWLRAETSFGSACSEAAKGGHLEALMYLRNEGCVWVPQFISDDAASSGSIEVVEWLRQQQRIEFGASALNAAAREGQTAMCNHLRSICIGCDWGADTCEQATTGGYLDNCNGEETTAVLGSSARYALLQPILDTLAYLTTLKSKVKY
jgi:hypothetical protein